MKNISSISKKVLFLVCCAFSIFVGFKANEVNAFGSKIPINITERSGNDLKDHQVRIDLNEYNFSFDIDKEKISFADSGGNNLDHWIESWNIETKEAKVWVKIPFLEADRSIEIYFDENGLGKSDGGRTFDFFDDFSDGNWDFDPVWTREVGCTFEGGDIKIVSDYPQTQALQMIRTSTGCGSGITAPFSQDYGIWHAKIKKTGGNDKNGVHFYLSYGGNGDYVLDVSSDGVKLFGPSWRQIGSTYRQRMGEWHAYDIIRDPKGNWTVLVDGVARITGTDNTGTINSKIAIRTISWESSKVDYADDIYFRKYASPEPEVSIGDDLSLSSDDLSVIRQGQDTYLIKGTALSFFKENLKNIDVAIYDADPLKNNNLSVLGRFTINDIVSLKETEFETSVKLNPDIKELYLFIDPDHTLKESNQTNNVAYTNKIKKEENNLDTLAPFLKNIIVFLALFLVIFLLYKLSSTIKNTATSSSRALPRTKTCLKCGMVVDEMQPKCPVCGSEIFK